MDEAKRQRLEAAGWKVSNTTEFLQLSPEENTFIELKLALTQRLKESRARVLSKIMRCSNCSLRELPMLNLLKLLKE
ncbi:MULTISPECIES: hypothetical protein [Spirulina sp. CCY15215]|uniref:hypothetical protein n=1 Tax=Spirulina sp. CCY15215 TaxID=2767591 RepID=UPI001950CAFB|nr:hypothetical protein [Spirulina major]